MEYRMTQPPANASLEDLQRWMIAELMRLEQVLAEFQQNSSTGGGA